MKIAYLTSRYPDVSHTFIMREVGALRARGIELGTFSVRRAHAQNSLGPDARREAAATRWLVPPSVGHLVPALAWSVSTRPLRTAGTVLNAALAKRMNLGRRIKWFLYAVEAILLAYWLARDRFDHLHCHFGNSGSSTGMLAARLAGIPFSITCHGSELREIEKQRLVEKVSHAAFVACVSKYGRGQLMLTCKPEHWTKLYVVRCGVSQSGARTQPSGDGPPNVLCVARLSAEKGHLVLLDALATLRDAGVCFRCTLVGDGPMRQAIQASAEKMGLCDRVTFTGSLDPDGVAEAYRSADVVALASFTEGVPVVLMEAMSRGLPVVATTVGGVPELVEDGRNGLLVPPGDAAALAAALGRVLDDSQWATSLGLRAVQDVRREFDLEASASQLAKLFSEVHRRGDRGDTEAADKRDLCPAKLTALDS